MTYFMGIDIGSSTSKGVITRDGKPEAHHLLISGVNYREAARQLRNGLLAKLSLSMGDITCTVATGQGSANVEYCDQQVADIRCCARGITNIFPLARTVIDVQGQYTQVLRLSEQGTVIDFTISEKCASGSGRFLDIISNVLQIKLEDIGPLSLKSDNPVKFTTGCAVFGESEAVSRVSEGVSKEDILAGVHQALAEKISALVNKVGLEEKCAISGGGALNIGLIKRVENKLGVELLVPSEPQYVTALGAAIMAEEVCKVTDEQVKQ
ncbi:MAG TPA: 2-hydroxyglutaryl-CoA dehydratase [Dehalococcoidia bacterium]|nr:2-hydroxyglutaryl-CoA dehydratase [Dehalococcoidia bacterium]